jgi:hypothetical protein
MTMTEHKWLGVDAVAGARVGPLELTLRRGSCNVYMDRLANQQSCILMGVPLSEVDARTRAWIRSLSSLLMPGFGVCPACEMDFNTPDHDPFCSSCVEAGWAEAYRRGHAAGLGADVVALLEAGERLRDEIGHPKHGVFAELAREYDAAREKAGR